MPVLRVFLRRKTALALSAAIALAITAFLCLYANMFAAMREQLSQMAEEIPVTAKISNRAGTRTSGLYIPAEKLDKLNETGISEITYAATGLMIADGEREKALLTLDDFKEMEWEEDINLSVDTTLDFLQLKPGEEVTFLPGYTAEDLQTDKPYCVITQRLADEKELSLGDCYLVTAYRYVRREQKAYRVGAFELTVIGIISSEKPTFNVSDTLRIFASDAAARALCAANDFPYYYHTASLRILDPMRLNDWKQRARELNLSPVNVMTAEPTSLAGNSLTVYDEVFVNAVTPVMQNLRIFRLLLFPIFCIIVFIGGIVSYMLVNHQRREIAVCRSLGVKKAAVALGLIAQSLLPCLVGMALGGVITLPFVRWTAETLWMLAGFVLCYLIGCFISVLLINRDNITLALTKTE